MYRNSYMRMYMARYNLKKRWEQQEQRTSSDKQVLAGQHMTGLGTFELNGSPHKDIVREHKLIQSLKAQIDG